MPAMHDPQAEGILRRLRSPDPRDGWAAFLDACSSLLLEVIRFFERDEVAIGDCYLFACEQPSGKLPAGGGNLSDLSV